MDWVNNVGAPLAVTAVDLGLESTKPEWSEWATYVMAAVPYIGGIMGIKALQGKFIENVGIAALPGAARNIYERVRGISSPVRRLSMRRVSRWPAPLVEQPFGGARLV